METHTANIAIDGPAGAGKSTMAKHLASELGFIHVDTGAMYRTLGLHFLRKGISSGDREAVRAGLSSAEVDLSYENGRQRMYLNGEDVTDRIRTPEVSAQASDISAIPEVRAYLLNMQRELAKKHNVIMDGRDIGTVILPEAEIKLFLTASPEKRAERRYLELRENGVETTYEETYSDMLRRDLNDSSRSLAPLRPAEDSIIVDTDSYDLEESKAFLLSLVKERLNGYKKI